MTLPIGEPLVSCNKRKKNAINDEKKSLGPRLVGFLGGAARLGKGKFQTTVKENGRGKGKKRYDTLMT